MGCASPAGEDSRCIARHAILLAGLPIEVPGAVFQRNCGSGLNAIISSAHAITCGEGDIFVAGGVESMTRAPFVVGKSEQAFGKDFKVFDSAIGALKSPNGGENEALKSVEKQIGDLFTQLDLTQAQLGRLDQIERRRSEPASHVSEDRMA